MRIPLTFYMNNCKVIQELYKKEIPALEKVAISVGNGSTVYLARKENFPFSYYEKIVCDAVYSIWQSRRYELLTGKRREETGFLTPTEVLACMSGKSNIRIKKEAPGVSEKEERLVKILDTLSCADIAIFWEEEREERQITGVSSVFAGKMLPLKRVEGTKKFRLNLMVGLPLYEYASAIHQMIRIPEKLLSCPAEQMEDGHIIPALVLPNTDEVIQLKHILLQRIEILRNEKNGFHNGSIRYYYPSHKKAGTVDGIFALMKIYEEDYGSASAWSNRKQALHRQVRKILDYYCSIGYLEGYKDAGEVEGHMRRKGIIGVDIIGEKR